MAFTPTDQDIRDQITNDLDRNLCVEAGAGTGKTTSLVSRITELLASGRATADDIAVITFTEKAAAELSTRVREQLENAARDATDPTRKTRLDKAIHDLYRARIETIHSFASNLLRERPVEAALDPGFTVMTNLEAQLAFDTAYKSWLDELMAGDHPEVPRALNVGLGLDEIRSAAETLNRFRFLLPLSPFVTPADEPNELLDWVQTHAPELAAIGDRCTDEDDGSFPVLEKLARFAKQIDDEGTTESARERLVAMTAPALKKAGRQSSWPDANDCKRMKGLIDEYREIRGRVRDAMRSRALLDVLSHIDRFVRVYEAERRANGVADFDDLLLWARDLLRDRPEVRHYFQRRFTALLIDEFQDTDPVQVEIAAFLTGDGETTSDWRTIDPVPGKLFVVGDPKQSIYRFRRADIAIYDEVKRGPLDDDLLAIVQNFRSMPGVVAWVNRVFNELLIERPGIQPPNVELRAVSDQPPLEGPPVTLLHGSGDELNADGVRELEASAAAALLSQAVRGETPWTVRDRGTGDVRHARWKDVAILLPARTGLEAYETAFATVGIPYRHEGSRDYFQRQEVRDLVALLQAIDDPSNRLAIVTALRSSAFGCSDDDLVIHKAGGAPWDYRVDELSQSAAVAEGFAALREWHRLRARRSLPQLVRAVVEESKLVEFALTLPDGAQAAANLLAIVDQGRAFSAAGGGGLRPFARWLIDHTEEELPGLDAGIAEETDDVVRLMTMHGSKGLEFPIVVLANLGSRGQNVSEPVPEEAASKLHFRVGVGTKGGYYATPGYDDAWESEKDALKAEELRLLYVAATRARDHLVVPCIKGKAKLARFMAELEPLLPPREGHEVELDGMWLIDAALLPAPPEVKTVEVVPNAGAVEAAQEERAEWIVDYETIVGAARKELPFVVASSVERATRPLSAEASHSGATLLLSDGPPLPVGDALHLVMERVSLPAADDLDAVVESVCTEAGLLDRLEEVREMAVRCLASETVKRGIASGTWRREVPFTVEQDGGYATGRVDAVFEEGGELVIVDFKSDDVSGDEAAHEAFTLRHHGGQADAYAGALGRASGRTVAGVSFVYGRTSAEVWCNEAEQRASGTHHRLVAAHRST